MTQLGLRDRVRLELNPDHVGVWSGSSRPADTRPDGARPDDTERTSTQEKEQGDGPAADDRGAPPPTRRSLRERQERDDD